MTDGELQIFRGVAVLLTRVEGCNDDNDDFPLV